MEIIELNTDNVLDYGGILDPDISESIGRDFFRGVIALDQSKKSVRELSAKLFGKKTGDRVVYGCRE